MPYGYVIFGRRSTRERLPPEYNNILREASAGLLVLLRWAIPGPQSVGRATSTALTHFCITNLNQERRLSFMDITRMISLIDNARNGKEIRKNMDVELPIVGKAKIYGFIPHDSNPLSSTLDCPFLGKANIVANRCIATIDGKSFHRFPIFTSVSTTAQEEFPVYLLYIPRLLENTKNPTYPDYYLSALKSRNYNWNVSRIEEIHTADGVAYYSRRHDELLFESDSELSGLANSFSVITYRESPKTGETLYEVYNANDVQLADTNKC